MASQSRNCAITFLGTAVKTMHFGFKETWMLELLPLVLEVFKTHIQKFCL